MWTFKRRVVAWISWVIITIWVFLPMGTLGMGDWRWWATMVYFGLLFCVGYVLVVEQGD